MPDLFDWTPPLEAEPRARKGVTTSEAAARSMRACSQPLQRRIVAFMRHRRSMGATYDEIVVGLGLEKPTVAGRLNDLRSGGFIAFGKETRPTSSGRPARVYWLTARGLDLAARIEKGRAS